MRASSSNGVERLVVGRGQVRRAAGVVEEGVLGADAGIVEPGADRVRLEDLPVVVGQDVGARAVQDADAAPVSVAACCPVSIPSPGRLDADERDAGVGEERVEHAHRVRAAADAGDHRVGQPPFEAHGSARAPRRR